jgi:hypothetical protein
VGKSDHEHGQEPAPESEQEAAVLPAREAMSLISPGPASGFVPDLDALPTMDAAAAGSAEENVTSEDRSEHFENRDSASSET